MTSQKDVLDICDEMIEEAKANSIKINESAKEYLERNIQYFFALNGAAAVAVTSMFTTIFIEKPFLAKTVFYSLYAFLMGSIFCVLAIIAKFFGYRYLVKSSETETAIFKGIKDYIIFLRKNRNTEEEIKLKKCKECISFSSAKKFINNNSRLINLSVFFVFCSLAAFITGIFLATRPFIAEINKTEKEQVYFVNDLYRGVTVNPSPITKPN